MIPTDLASIIALLIILIVLLVDKANYAWAADRL